MIGSGRSTPLKALFGLRQETTGKVTVDGRAVSPESCRAAMDMGLAYVPEDRLGDAAFSGLSVGENTYITVLPKYWRHGFLQRRPERKDNANLFDAFRVKAASDEAPLRSLSGGNQQKVILARWLRREPRVLLLDEPTQGVDVGARAEIYELIHRAVAEGAVALVVSSDFEELARICDRVLVMRHDKLIDELQVDELGAEAIAKAANAEIRAG